MKNLKIENFWTLLIVLSVVTFWFFGGSGKSLGDVYNKVGDVTLTMGILTALFAKFGWKWKFFQGWLVPYPNLSGSWKGEISSDWFDHDKGKKIKPINAIVSIRQSFLSIKIVVFTRESVSYSFAENFHVNSETQEKYLIFSYRTQSGLLHSDENPRHQGTAKLRIVEKPRKLSGEYWSDRKTRGEIVLKFYKHEQTEEFK